MIIEVLVNRFPTKLAVRLDLQSNPLLPPTPIFSLNRYPAPPVRGISVPAAHAADPLFRQCHRRFASMIVGHIVFFLSKQF